SNVLFSTGDGTADATMTFSGAIVNLNDALDSLSFTPTPDYYGSASLSFTVSDGDAGPVNRAVALTITAVVDITDDSVSTNEDTPITFNAITGTNGATADTFEGSPSVTSVTQGLHGGITFAANGDLTYTPTSGYSGPDSFTYTVTSGGVTETAAVSVTVVNVSVATLVVDNLTDNIALNQCVTATPGDCSLRGAVSVAQDGDTIVFASNLSSLSSVEGGIPTITLVGSEIEIATDLTIAGPGADKLIVNGGGGQNRIFLINGLSLNVVISGLSLTSGGGFGGGISSVGGAIFAHCQLTLDGVHIYENSTASGGGVGFVDGGPYTIKNSTINTNVASLNGGGIDKEGSGVLTVTNSTISGNTLTGASAIGGGGIFSGGTDGNLIIRNSTITGNSANKGGGIGIIGGSLSLGSTIIAGNSVPVATDGPEINTVLPSSVTSAGFNMIGDSAGDASNTGASIAYLSSDILDTNPQLGPLQNNGGPTLTHKPQAGFAGHDKGCAFGAAMDQRGYGRTVDWPGIPNGQCTGAEGIPVATFGTDIGSVELLLPTAANATISGRATTAGGRGIAKVTVEVRDIQGNQIGSVYTNTFGYFTVFNVPAGGDYVVMVRSKRYTFSTSTLILSVTDNVEGLQFVADAIEQ
ncbi:MAG: cadherin-like domain-containing protein, partial [Pyrinomonadaceae bacterium]